MVKTYLDKKGVREKRFQNNFPGIEWSINFLKRNKDLTERFSSNIKKKRAAISQKVIEEYMTNLEEELKDVPVHSIYNYDETNLTDDPGNETILCKPGTKYPELIMNTSKASISLMYCASTSEILLPPYVVYKAERLYDRWTEGGPKNARYNRSKSGWFDSTTFEDWFFTLALPQMKKTPRKVSHDWRQPFISCKPECLESCEENDIAFVCLPPNITHLTQPLDIAFFRPMKIKWRQVLTDWKMRKKNSQTMPKDVFPRQLKKLHEILEANCS